MIQRFSLIGYILVFLSLISYSQQPDSLVAEEKVVSDKITKKTGLIVPTREVPAVFVVFEGDTLFTVNSTFGPYTATERANTVIKRLDQIVESNVFSVDSFSIQEFGNQFFISYEETMIVSIGEYEAKYLGVSREEAAQNYLDSIITAISTTIEDKSLIQWLTNIGYTILTLAGLFLIIFLINRLFKWVNKKLVDYEKNLKRKRKSVFRYLAPRGPDYFFIFVSNLLRFALIIVVLVLYLPLLFNFMPWTKGLVSQFYEYIFKPLTYIAQGLVAYLPNLFYIFIIVAIARYLLKILTFAAQEIQDDKLKLTGFHKDWAHPTLIIIKVLINAFALVFMFPYLPGSDSPAFQGVSIFLGVLFSLGSTSAIANIVAGIVITYMRPFMIGDRVRIGETVGDVIEKSLLVTRLRTPKNEDVTIPNSTIINTHLWNFTKNAKELGIILHPTITIGYDVPSETVINLLLKAAKNTKNLTRDFKPFVLQKSLNDFYVEYELNVYSKQPSKMLHFYSELNQSIQREFNEAGVEILSPHYHSIRDGNASTISGAEEEIRNPVEKVIDKVTGKDQAKPKK